MTVGNNAAAVTIVAVGPGDAQMLTLKGKAALENADLVAGFTTVLDVVRPLLDHAELCPMSYRDQEDVLEYAVGQSRQGRRLVVCCWGDLNVSARELLARVQKRADRIELIPGISSVQIACARAGIFLEDSLFLTLHKRLESDDDLQELVQHLKESRRNLILLPRPWDLMPPKIAQDLLDSGIEPGRPVTVFQRLTLPDESEWTGRLDQCAATTQEFSDLSIMLFRPPESNGGVSPGAGGG